MTRVFTPWRRTAAVTALVLLLVILLAWIARTFLAARLVELYLLARGVPASIEVSRLDWQGLDASARLGARRTPDLSIAQIHAAFDGSWIPDVQSLTLSHSVLRIAYDGEKLSFGTLQRLVDSAFAPAREVVPTNAPSTKGSLHIVLRDARVIGFTPAGVVTLAGNGTVTGGRIDRFQGAIGRANLRAPGFAFLLSGGSFAARSADSGLDLYVRLNGHGLSFRHMRAAEVQVTADVSDFAASAFRQAKLNARMLSLRGQGVSIADAMLRASLGAWHDGDGSWSGPLDVLADLETARTKSFDAAKASLHLQSPVLRLENASLSGPIAADLTMAAARYRFKTAPLEMVSLAASAKGEVGLGDKVAASLTASLSADLAMASASARRFAHDVPILGDDPRNVRGIAAALRSAHLEVPDIYIGKSASPLVVTLPQPATFAARNGARANIAQRGDVFFSRDADGRMTGGFSAAISGPDLPRLALNVPRYAAREKANGLVLDSTLDLSAKASLRSLRDTRLVTNGHLTAEDGAYAFVPNGCAKAGLGAYVSNGKTSLSNLSADICPLPNQPLLSSTPDGWQVRGRWRNLSARLDAADAQASSATGRLDISGNSAGLGNGFVETARARVTDNKATPRFTPLLASGRLNLADAQWRGTIGIVIAKTNRKLAIVTVHHDSGTSRGEASIVSDLAFVPEGFQPGELSPLLASLTQAKGNAQFRGHIEWTADGQTSGGTLIVDDADFNGPLGAIKHAHTQIAFTSLTPLATASAQTLSAQKIEWLVPFSNLLLRFQLDEEALRIESFDAAAAGGQVALAPMSIVLDPKATMSGTLKLAHFNLGALVAASNLADKVSLDTPVSGAIPFRYGPNGLHMTDGYLASTGPSRLSIRRTVWTGGKPQPETDAITDFAYQALENLAIDELDAKLNSLPGGRLGVIFHINGRNDPAIAQETRISVVDLLQGHAFDKPVPLPKGTPVDLTLDTSLNFDELLDAYRNAFSASVAEAAATSEQNEGITP